MRLRVSFIVIIGIVTAFAFTLYSSIHFSYNNTNAVARMTMTPYTYQQEQLQEEVDEGRSEDDGQGMPALESSFAGILSINRIVQTANYSHFLPLSNSQGNQVKVIVDYSTISPLIIGQPINAILEIHSVDNQSLVKTSSFPDPIIANDTGTIQLATTLTDKTLTDVIAIITFSDDSKLVPISDPIHLLLRFGESSSLSS